MAPGQGTICSLSTVNLSVLGGVVVLTLLFKRVFCTTSAARGGPRVGGARGPAPRDPERRLPHRLERALEWLKYLCSP